MDPTTKPEGKVSTPPPSTPSREWRLDPIITLLVGIVGLFGIIIYVFYPDMQDVKKQLQSLAVRDTQAESETTALKKDIERDVKLRLNVWAGEEFGAMCSLFGGQYNFNSHECASVKSKGIEATEVIRYKPPFPELSQ